MKPTRKTGLLLSCLAFSIIVHILVIYALRMFGTYDFAAPVNWSHLVEVNLEKLSDRASPPVKPEQHERKESSHVGEDEPARENTATTEKHAPSSAPQKPEQLKPEPKLPTSSSNSRKNLNASIRNIAASGADANDEASHHEQSANKLYPLGNPTDFLATKNEKLTYSISMLGLPVGSAELEAKNDNGEIWLTLRVKSNAAISSIFPVDDLVETRHIGGRFIMSRIKQQEGSFRSDEGFTINLIKKRVSWFDYIGGRSLTSTIPTDEVIDTLSGIYFLRNRQLEIGTSETLHIFDSEIYAEVPVEILRQETVILPNFTKVDTLVVQPLQKTAGIFRRTGDVLIWMTNDDNKVPVRIETTVALGKVTIELLSAESKPLDEGLKKSE